MIYAVYAGDTILGFFAQESDAVNSIELTYGRCRKPMWDEGQDILLCTNTGVYLRIKGHEVNHSPISLKK